MNNKGFAITTILYGLLILFLMLLISLLGMLSSYKHRLEVLVENTNGARDIINGKNIYAIYSNDDKSLRFYKINYIINEGEYYNGKIVTAVYTDFEDKKIEINTDAKTTNAPWYEYKNEIEIIEFVDEIIPTNTSAWFAYLENCKEIDVTKLNVSNVTDMSHMFRRNGYKASTFKIVGLDNWDISNVTNIEGMFSGAGNSATTWNIGNLSKWDTSNITTMASMFDSAGYNATTWDVGNLSNWNTSKVANMFRTFAGAGKSSITWTIGDLSNWDTGEVTTMESMFHNSGSDAGTWNIGDISNWNTSNVTSFRAMFAYAGESAAAWNIGKLDRWNTSNVTDMGGMFSHVGRNALTLSLGDLSTKEVTLENGTTYTAWDVSNVIDMHFMFENLGEIKTTKIELNLSNWDVSKVETMQSMLECIGKDKANEVIIKGLDTWKTINVKDMSHMFRETGYNADKFEIDLSSWDVSNVTDMGYMFYCTGYGVDVIKFGDLSNWNTKNVENMAYMFQNTGYNATTFDIGNLSSWNVSKVKYMTDMFANAWHSATSWLLDLSNWNIEKVVDRRGFEAGVYDKIKEPKWNNGKTYYVVYSEKDNSLTFYNHENVIEEGKEYNGKVVTKKYEIYEKDIFLNADNIPWKEKREVITNVKFENKVELTGTAYLFYGFKNCASFNLDKLNKSSITDMSYMFYEAGYNVLSFDLDLSGWDTSNVIKTNYMFYQAGYNSTESFKLNLSEWNLENLYLANNMFQNAGYNAQTFEFNLSNWKNITKLLSAQYMFSHIGYNSFEKFEIYGINDWYLPNTVYIDYMFQNAGYNATYILDLSEWKACKASVNDTYKTFESGVENKIIEPNWRPSSKYCGNN